MQGGYVTLPWWRGGASGGAVTQGGYRTLPWWQAGGTGTAPVAGGGFITWPWWMAGGTGAAAEDRHVLKRIPWREWYVRTYTGWPEVKRVERRERPAALEVVLPREEVVTEALGERLAGLFVLPALGDAERAMERLEAAYEAPEAERVEAAEKDVEEAVERLQWVLDEAIARADEEEAAALLLLSL